ncbi:ComEC/Rec2 family competence protein [Fodinisporobacter ferrooxydans]|uniref:ComEC/Rec2 family competence protein n=1 Tax=Fodinisporobacter ferrooxydans TaxID=2901836 RepID=A0ABY4CF45_9BACL|nr:ComEC/Rec2 family competence protein [Alicyclobacillaceae bacterium MYW30-H2]
MNAKISRSLLVIAITSLSGMSLGLIAASTRFWIMNACLWGVSVLFSFVQTRIRRNRYKHSIQPPDYSLHVLLFLFVLSGWKSYLALSTEESLIHTAPIKSGKSGRQVEWMSIQVDSQPMYTKRPTWRQVPVKIVSKHGEPAIFLFQPAEIQRQTERSSMAPLQRGDAISGYFFVKKATPQGKSLQMPDIWRRVHELTRPQYIVSAPSRPISSRELQSSPWQIASKRPAVRQKILNILYEKLRNVLPEEDVSFVFGLMFGDTHGIRPDVKQSFTILGISHILAVSGMNIELLICPLQWTFRFFRIPFRASNALTCVLITCFGWLADGGASVMRAVLAGNIKLIGDICNRKSDPLTALACSSLVCTWLNPFSIADLSFEFSFMASLFLILFSSSFQKRFMNIPLLRHMNMEIYCAATAATIPIQLYVFKQWSPYSVLANLLYEPLIPLVMIAILILLATSLVLPPIAYGMGFILHPLLWILDVPPVWFMNHAGIYIVSFNQQEVTWSLGIYALAAAWLIYEDRPFLFLYRKRKQGHDTR